MACGFDLRLVSLTLHRAPVAERRGYKNVVDALARIVREEGVATLWRVSGVLSSL